MGHLEIRLGLLVSKVTSTTTPAVHDIARLSCPGDMPTLSRVHKILTTMQKQGPGLKRLSLSVECSMNLRCYDPPFYLVPACWTVEYPAPAASIRLANNQQTEAPQRSRGILSVGDTDAYITTQGSHSEDSCWLEARRAEMAERYEEPYDERYDERYRERFSLAMTNGGH